MKKILPLFLLLAACANKVEVPNKITQEQTGSATLTVNVTITFGFLDQLHQLCEDEYATTTFVDDNQHRKTVADCVVGKLTGLSSATANVPTQVQSQYCNANADLSAFTPAQIVQIQALCASLQGK